jgi:hypothetical protein
MYLLMVEEGADYLIVCWDYLQLGISPWNPIEAELMPEKGKDLEVEVNAIDTLDTTCARMEPITV